jgi:hypothetical protein
MRAPKRTHPESDISVYGQGLSCQSVPFGGGADRDRTDDLKLAKLALSQLSYGPGTLAASASQMVGPGRVERPTSRLSGVRSNHLSYEPVFHGPLAKTIHNLAQPIPLHGR